MSRREFRGRVHGPRPPYSIALVAIASTALGATGAVPVFVLALQALLVGTALLLRHRPRSLQQSALALRSAAWAAFALGCASGAGGIARGLGAGIMLCQGVQLLDARPRRTEFPLVALALGQIVLAADIDESFVFLPLLVLFLLAAVWTLLLHTLHVEAAEAGDASASAPLVGPRLLQMTLLSTLCTGLFAALIFVALPRMRAALDHPGGRWLTQNLSGFSDRVTLGTIGQIRKDSTLQLRVSTRHGKLPARTEAYFRGMAFDRFDGWEWSVTPSPTTALYPSRAGTRIVLRPGNGAAELSIVREPTSPGVIFAPERVFAFEGSVELLERDRNGNLVAADSDGNRIAYRLVYQPEVPGEVQLQEDAVSLPVPDASRYVALPKDPALAVLLEERAREITRGARSDAERARRIERYLRKNGRYTDTPPVVDRTRGPSPIQVFLEGGLAAHCEYFASSMALLARALGMPARLVNGFAGGDYNPAGKYLELTGSDAHAWVEIHFRKAGWVRYDPTPPDLRLPPLEAPGLARQIEGLFSAFDLWWFVNVADFNRNTQIRALQSGKSRLVDFAKLFPDKRKRFAAAMRGILRELPLWLILVVSGTLLTISLPLLARMRLCGGRRTMPEYNQALRLLRRRHLVPAPTATPRDFARRAARELPAGAAEAFRALTESFQAQRYGGHKSTTAKAELRKLRDNLGS